MRLALLTCNAYPQLSAGDSLLADALRGMGHSVVAVPWNDESDRVESADVAVLRSNWDYHDDLDAFLLWLDTIERAGTRVVNDPQLVRWNADKRYLLELAERGIAVPLTVDAPSNSDALESWFAETGLSAAVHKPAWGASGHLVNLLRAGDPTSADLLASSAAAGRPFMIQEFVPSITQGEHALVFFDGVLSHTFLRSPSENEFRINSQYGGTVKQTIATPELLEFGLRVLDALPSRPTYARVDIVSTPTGPILMEVELNEPSLALHLADGAPDLFARAICRFVDESL